MDWIKSMPGLIKATVAVVALLVGLGFALSDFRGLPEQVMANTDSIQSLRSFDRGVRVYMEEQDRRWERVLCHLEEQRKENPQWARCER